MKCNKCNAEIEAGASFCSVCGNNVAWQTMALDELVCPHCFKPIDNQTIFCGYCGKNVSQQPAQVEGTVENVIEEVIKENEEVIEEPCVPVCEKCGNKLVEGASFCGGCGNQIGAQNIPENIEADNFVPKQEDPFYKTDSAFQYGGGYVEPAVRRRNVQKQGIDKGIIILLAVLAVVVMLSAVIIAAAFINKPGPAMSSPDINGSVILKSTSGFIKSGVLR